jgi:tetratricopeptide (TPR) repeat protein
MHDRPDYPPRPARAFEIPPTTGAPDTFAQAEPARARNAVPSDAPAALAPQRLLTGPELARAAYAPGTPLPSAVAAWQLQTQREWRRALRHAISWTVTVVALLAVLVPAGPGKDGLYAAAAAARAAWRYDRALIFYQQAAALDPNDPRPECLIGQVLALQQRYAQAAEAYTRCQVLGDMSPDTWLAVGDIAQARRDVGGAERAWLRSAAQGGTQARRRLGLFYESQGQFDQAEAQWSALAEAQRHTPTTADGQAQVHLGLLALRRADYDAARAHLIAARELPGFYGQDAVDQGFVALAALGPQDGVGLARVGVAFVSADMLTFARLPLEQAIALMPTYGPAHAYLAWVDWVAGQSGAAHAEVSNALRLTPRDPFTLFVAAEQAMAAGKWSAAGTALDLALKQDGKNPVLWAEQGRADLARADYLHAELSFETAAYLGTEPAFTVLFLRFYLDHHTGLDNGRALLAASRAAVRWPDQEQVQELVGQLYDLADQPTLAFLAYERANQLDPSDPQPYLDLGRVAVLGGEYDTAALDLRTVLALHPDGPLAAQARALLAPVAGYDI